MGYGMQIPAHRVGRPKKLWDFRVYGLSESWVKRVPTVSSTLPFQHCIKEEEFNRITVVTRARECDTMTGPRFDR